jgi:hypothetical protein
MAERLAAGLAALVVVVAVGACQASGPVPQSSPGPSINAEPAPASPGPKDIPADPLPVRGATVTCDDSGPPRGGPSRGVETSIDHAIVPEDPDGIRIGVLNLTSLAVIVEPRETLRDIQVEPVAPGAGSVLLPFAIGSHQVRCSFAGMDRVGTGPSVAGVADDIGWVELRVVDRDRYLDPIGSGCLYGDAYGASLVDGVRTASVGLTATTPRPPCRV